MKIKIRKLENSVLAKDLEIDLAPLTVFAGENNAGKTRLAKALGGELENMDVDVIHIPAERVLLAAEIKTGAEGDPFRAALIDLIDVDFSPDDVKSLVTDIEKILPKEFSRYNVKKTSISVKTKTPKTDDYIKALKEVYIKKLIESISIKDGYFNKDDIKPSEVGQGTQRLIIVSLLKYIGEKKKEKKGATKKPTYIVFEEPEIYLHPKLKQTLYNVLSDLTKNADIRVIITTHDPYFIELAKEDKIYRVRRDDESATVINELKEEALLLYKSHSEINYLIFDIPSRTYFLELYEYLLSFFEGKEDICKDCGKNKGLSDINILNKWIVTDGAMDVEIETDSSNKNNSLVAKLRHQLGHPDVKGKATEISEDYIARRIKELRGLITLIKKSSNI